MRLRFAMYSMRIASRIVQKLQKFGKMSEVPTSTGTSSVVDLAVLADVVLLL
jgi:hypothetical protein